MNYLDHLLPFVDKGGRRSYIERRRNSKIAARIPERRSGKERRTISDRRKTLRYDNVDGFSEQDEKCSGYLKKIL